MQPKTVRITMLDGSQWYVPEDTFVHAGVSERADSIISNYIRGTRGPLLKVNKNADMSGEYEKVNAHFILSMHVEYE